MNTIEVVYQGEYDKYTIEHELLADEIIGIMTNTEVTFATLNGVKIK